MAVDDDKTLMKKTPPTTTITPTTITRRTKQGNNRKIEKEEKDNKEKSTAQIPQETVKRKSYVETDLEDAEERRRLISEFESSGRQFKRQFSKQETIKGNTGERPHQCFECHKRFSTSGNLARHRKIHSIPINSLCSALTFDNNEAISNSIQLKLLSDYHPASKTYFCRFRGCGRDFSSSGNLGRHIRLTHNYDTKIKLEVEENLLKTTTTTTTTKEEKKLNGTIKKKLNQSKIKLNTTSKKNQIKKTKIKKTEKIKKKTKENRNSSSLACKESEQKQQMEEEYLFIKDEGNNLLPTRRRSMVLDIPRIANVPRIDDNYNAKIPDIYGIPGATDPSLSLVDYDSAALIDQCIRLSYCKDSNASSSALLPPSDSEDTDSLVQPFHDFNCEDYQDTEYFDQLQHSSVSDTWVDDLDNLLKQQNVFDDILTEDWSEKPCHQDVFSISHNNGRTPSNYTSPFLSYKNKKVISSATLSA